MTCGTFLCYITYCEKTLHFNMLSLRIANGMQKTHTSGGVNISGWGWRLPSSVGEFRVDVGWPYGKRPALQVYGSQWYGRCM